MTILRVALLQHRTARLSLPLAAGALAKKRYELENDSVNPVVSKNGKIKTAATEGRSP